MSASIRNRKKGSVVFKDGTGTPITLTLGPTSGDFSAEPLGFGWVNGAGFTIPYEQVQVMSRGSHLEFAEGDDVPINLSITVFHAQKLHDGTNPALLDLLMKLGAFASGTSGDAGTWTGGITYTVTQGGTTLTIVFANCTMTGAFSEAQDVNTIKLSAKAVGGYKVTES